MAKKLRGVFLLPGFLTVIFPKLHTPVTHLKLLTSMDTQTVSVTFLPL